MRDIVASVLLLVFAAAVLINVRGLDLGSVTRPGPGAFPTALAIILLGIGILVLLRALRAGRRAIGGVATRPLVAVMAAFIGFGLTIDRAGLVPATIVLVLCAALGFDRLRKLETAIIAGALSAFGALVFVWLLRLPLPLWRW